MNRIVREHYPAARLPEDLRREIGVAETVTLVIEAEASRPARTRQQAVDEGLSERAVSEIQAAAASDPSGDGPLMRIVESVRERRVMTDDPVERVRALRAEWGVRDAHHDRIRSGGRG